MTLIYLSCAWVVGVLLGSIFSPHYAFLLTGLIPLSLLFLGRRYRKLIIIVSLCLTIFFGGALSFQLNLPAADENHLPFYNDRGTVHIKGIVRDDPEVRDKTTHLRLSAIELKADKDWQPVSGTVLIFVPRYPEYEYGDLLSVTGELETPLAFDDFDYAGYLARQGIYATMRYPGIEILERGRGAKPLAWVYSVRNRLSLTMGTLLPEPQASLAQGIILGIRGNIPESVRNDFSRTGTAHILAISGLHLSIVAGIILSLGIWLFGRRYNLYVWLAMTAIWLYAILTGLHPPVIRGAIMASLFLTAILLGRQRSALPSLALAAVIMVGINPGILWSASFQLSFLAMAGLIFLAPRFMALGRKVVNCILGEDGAAVVAANVVVDSFGITLGAIIAVWPLIAYYFGIVSLLSLPATFLILPALPGIIITGALAGGLGLIALSAAQIVAWLAWLLLSYMLLVVNLFSAIPFSYAEVGTVGSNLVWAYYLGLALVVFTVRHRRQVCDLTVKSYNTAKPGLDKMTDIIVGLHRKWVIPPLLVAAILVSFVAVTMPDDKLHVSFLNIGQGDAILVQTPGHQDILIDGGPSPQAIGVELSRKMPFWDRTIDLVVLTHAHADHLTGLVEVLERYRVKQVLSPDFDYDSPLYEEWRNLINRKNIIHTVAVASQQINIGDGVKIKVLNPPSPLQSGTRSDIDNNGVVLSLSMEDINFLLTADIMWEQEFDLIARRADLTSTVLKVAHGASKTSTTAEFLAVVNPQVAVISVGADNRFGHPVPEILARLEEKMGEKNIFRTDERGTIEFITDGERLWVKTGD